MAVMFTIYLIGALATAVGILVLQKITAGEGVREINLRTVLFISILWFAFVPFLVFYMAMDLIGFLINLFFKSEE